MVWFRSNRLLAGVITVGLLALVRPVSARQARTVYEGMMPIDPSTADAETLTVRRPRPRRRSRVHVIINIPARLLRVYRRNELLLEVPTAVGRRVYPGVTGNTKTRIGDYYITSWKSNYRSRAYPVGWDRNPWRGAFGAHTARIGPNAAYQHIHGTIGPMWLGDLLLTKPGPRMKHEEESFRSYARYLACYEYGFSHGCTRVSNPGIAKFRKLCPYGTTVRKIYCLRERFASGKPDEYCDVILPNVYRYRDLGKGVYYPETGKLENYVPPKDAVGPAS